MGAGKRQVVRSLNRLHMHVHSGLYIEKKDNCSISKEGCSDSAEILQEDLGDPVKQFDEKAYDVDFAMAISSISILR